MKNIFRFISGLIIVVGVVLFASVVTMQSAGAQSAAESACIGSGGQWTNGACVSPNGRTVTGTLRQIANILIFIVGAISVIMIIVGGLRYAISQGDQSAVTSAKNTILYAIIGLVISVAAFGIVTFFTDALARTPSPQSQQSSNT